MEVTWTIEAKWVAHHSCTHPLTSMARIGQTANFSCIGSHAGGYQYRLAPSTEAPLTEADFQKMPLAFVGKQGLRWGGGPRFGGTEIFFNATCTTVLCFQLC